MRCGAESWERDDARGNSRFVQEPVDVPTRRQAGRQAGRPRQLYDIPRVSKRQWVTSALSYTGTYTETRAYTRARDSVYYLSAATPRERETFGSFASPLGSLSYYVRSSVSLCSYWPSLSLSLPRRFASFLL